MDNVNYSQPIEAVHIKGGVHPAQFCVRPSDLPHERRVKWLNNHYNWKFNDAGKPLSVMGYRLDEWTIRNTAKPSTPSNEELTQRMEIAPEVIERMNEAIRKFARYGAGDREDRTLYFSPRDFDVFRAIEADLPKPVDPIDPDLIEARKLAADCGIHGYLHRQITDGLCDDQPLVRHLHLGISRGRTLAAGGTE